MEVPVHVLDTAKNLPDKPGVYQFFDKNDKIIYVGKAKSLKKRVASYFNRIKDNFKTHLLVKKIYKIEYIEVSTEADALLLENNLIKNHQPKYNILLKDDKSFPWIVIKNEDFPRVFYTRNIIKDGSEYIGPFTSVVMVKTLLDLVKRLFKIRTCNLPLTSDRIAENKFKKCLEYHLGNCLAPCEGLQSFEDYNNQIEQIRNIIKGNLTEVKNYLKYLMHQYAQALDFEEAEKVKEKMEMLDRYQSKSTIVNPKLNNIEVYAYVEDDHSGYVNFLMIRNGAIVQAHTMELVKRISEDKADLLAFGIAEMKSRLNFNASERIVPFEVNFSVDNAKYTIPKVGDKLHLLQLAERNALNYKKEKDKRISIDKEIKTSVENRLEMVKKDLRLRDLPYHIECFDNSNIQGSNPVAACVVFRNGLPAKKEYRHFHIKSVTGPDDFGSMKEIVYRRYKRMLDEHQKLPQLIIIDGGKGQLSAAVESLKALSIYDQTAIVGIAKRLEEIYFPGDSLPIYMDKTSYTLKLIQQARNEAHRFGISFHRNARSKEFTQSALDSIKGIGPKTKDVLLAHFKNVHEIKSTDLPTLEKIVGKQKAEIIFNYFNNEI